MTAGGLAGMAMWAFAIPPDVIKSRYQGAPHGTYSGFMDCARKTVAQDGAKALFRGFGPAMLRAFPANAAIFVSREGLNKERERLGWRIKTRSREGKRLVLFVLNSF